MDPVAERALRYRNLAHEIRERANTATNDEIRQSFLKIAQGYDRIAELIEGADKKRS